MPQAQDLVACYSSVPESSRAACGRAKEALKPCPSSAILTPAFALSKSTQLCSRLLSAWSYSQEGLVLCTGLEGEGGLHRPKNGLWGSPGQRGENIWEHQKICCLQGEDSGFPRPGPSAEYQTPAGWLRKGEDAEGDGSGR